MGYVEAVLIIKHPINLSSAPGSRCAEAKRPRRYHHCYIGSLGDVAERYSSSFLPLKSQTHRLPGWRFVTPEEDPTISGDLAKPDPLHPGFTHLRDLYFSVNPSYEGRFTVPVLWDKKNNTIVSNESSEIIRMFYTEFDSLLPQKYRDVVLLPKDLRSQVEETNEWTYNDINNGVYKSGFATTQNAYEKAVTQLFVSLDRAEAHLKDQTGGPYYYGAAITEADVRLYTTIIRFDVVYVQHFKCNIRDIRSGYPYLHAWVRNLYWKHPESFGEGTTNFVHIKFHYTRSHPQVNPHGITPVGPLPAILGLGEEVAAVGKA